MPDGYFNSFLLSDDPCDVDNGRRCGVSRFNVVTRFPERFEKLDGVNVYKLVEKPADCGYDALALLTLKDEALLDAVADKVFGFNARLIAAADYCLKEIGDIEVKYGLTPVQLLDKLGLLERCCVAGGVALDRDDVDLMRQRKTKLILCPTCSLGYGFGMPHVKAYIDKLDLALGTGDNRFNKNGCMLAEARALYLGSNCDMRCRNSIPYDKLFKCFSSDCPDSPEDILFSQ